MKITLSEFKSNIDYYIDSLFSSGHDLTIDAGKGKLSVCVADLPTIDNGPDALETDANFLHEIKSYLESKGLRYEPVFNAIEARNGGKQFTLSEHIRALIYSLLSNQTPWSRIEPHLREIDQIFRDYDPDFIKSKPGSYFENALFQMKCGNRKTSAQMNSLHENMVTFERLITKFGSLDDFVVSAPAYEIVNLLSRNGSGYKLHQVGDALAWEYLRNVGIDGAKPDLHMRRFFGCKRMGASRHESASVQEVVNRVSELSKETGMSMATIDNLIWSFCADGYGEICTAAPKCRECVIRRYCNEGKRKD
jgi:endonuclease III